MTWCQNKNQFTKHQINFEKKFREKKNGIKKPHTHTHIMNNSFSQPNIYGLCIKYDIIEITEKTKLNKMWMSFEWSRNKKREIKINIMWETK